MLLKWLVGPSIRARLMRSFLPLIVGMILVEKWLDTVIFQQANSSPVLTSTLIAFISIIAMSALVSEISRSISGKIEQAEEERKRMQAMIEQAKNDWEQTFDIINDAITIHDKDFRIVRANRAAVELLDSSFSILLRQKCYVSYHGADCPPKGCPSCLTLKTGENSITEIFEPRLNRFLEIKALARRDGDGNVIGVVHVVRDITERKRAEMKVDESHKMLTTVLDSLDASVYVADMESHEVLYANKCLRDTYGNVEGKVCWQALQKSGINPCSFCTRDELLDVAGSPSGSITREFRHPVSGRWYSTSERAIRWTGGRIVRLEIAFDITQRRRTEKALLDAFTRIVEEKAKSEAIIAAIGDGISIQDTDFRIVYQNEIHKGFMGDRLGEYCYRAYEKRDHVCEGCPLAMSLRDGGIHRAERSVPGQKGLSCFEITTSPLRDAEGRIIAGIEVVRDVTESRKIKDQLLHSQKMDAVGQLAGGIAHDFNNILTAIMGYVYMLQTRMDRSSPLAAYVAEILDSASGAANLTRSLLAFSRKQLINPKPVNINDIIRRFGRLLRNLISEEIELNITPAYYDLTVVADRLQIEQVLMNLVTNARDAIPGGGDIRIASELAVLDTEFIKTNGYGTPGRYAVISVADTGAGMDEHTRERIFEPFFTTKEVGKGTGLGLSTAFGIVKQHNGYITVSSEPGKGSTFRIYLPLIRSKIIEKSMPDPALPRSGTETILVAEDEPAVRKAVKHTLEGFGYRLIVAEDGEDAVCKFVENKDDIRLLLLDVIMPKRNGREVYEEVRKMRPDIKVLFTSGYTADIIHKKGVLDEGLRFVPKPVIPKELLKAVREVLDK